MGWLDDLRRHLEQEPWVISKLKDSSIVQGAVDLSSSPYHYDNGFLKHKGRIVLSPTTNWREKVFHEHHNTLVAGHSGFLKTYKRISLSFYWKGMKGDIRRMVAECSVGQQNKYETLASPGLLNPLPVPQTVWTYISLDFIVRLLPCKGKTVIFVVVDRLSKYAHFVALSHPYTAHSVAQIFVDHIFKLHGMPATIVSDRDQVFLSAFWKEFCALQGSKLCLSSGYHPQSDGQNEVVNRCLETYMRCFCSLQPKKWLQWLSWAEWSYNTSYHSSSKLTLYEIVYGQRPPAVPTYESGTTKLDVVDQYLQTRSQILSQLKTNLEAAQVRMKHQVDKHRTERMFAVGDMVYLRLVPYQHQSLASHPFHKLQPKFYGPFEVLDRIGAVVTNSDFLLTPNYILFFMCRV